MDAYSGQTKKKAGIVVPAFFKAISILLNGGE